MQLEQAQGIAARNNQSVYFDGRNIRLESKDNPDIDYTTFSRYQFKNLSEGSFADTSDDYANDWDWVTDEDDCSEMLDLWGNPIND